MIIGSKYSNAFTLVELLAVIMVIVLLAGIMLGVAGYVQTTIAISSAKTQLAAMQAGLETYKSDWGAYPATGPGRISNRGDIEGSNNFILYNALCPTNTAAKGHKIYMRFPPAQIRTNPPTGLPTICDPWGTPYNYYCSPGSAYNVSNNLPDPVTGTNTAFTVGGQVNVRTYDLFSYGPDKMTYVSGAVWTRGFNSGWRQADWTNPITAKDDLGNFKQ